MRGKGYASRDDGRRGRALDLSDYLGPLRTRQGKTTGFPSQHGIGALARRMGLDPSIPQLWASGKRPVPLPRIPALREALAEQGITLPPGIEDGAPLPTRRIRDDRVPHVCPVCGVSFQGRAVRVYCSKSCAKRREPAPDFGPLDANGPTAWTVVRTCLACGHEQGGRGRACERCGTRSVVGDLVRGASPVETAALEQAA